MPERQIEIAREFSPYPGGRYAKDGTFSGEEFRERVLLPAIQSVPDEFDRIIVVFDGAAGYPSSFLEEAFGGLVRKHGYTTGQLSRILRLKATDPHFETYRLLAEQYMREAENRKEHTAAA